ncbi:hypothetical protein ACRALDRAFT_2114816 [Sodiomyces alcalophilus JCM 7366]|uniref:uncharacterized protein n=1 Tax=Sodiomyces alcalophilus JCM 7366 TaxID=591952 RepID=UPI0039B6C3A9
MLYGYDSDIAFAQQRLQLASMENEMNGSANGQSLRYPFFVVELKGDGTTGAGSLWVATNQCLGASAACVEIAERLNHQLRSCRDPSVRLIDTASFSIAMNGTEARLYISWKQNERDYYMQKIDSFLLQRPEHYIEFRKYIRNIIDWGKGSRLQEIRESLDILLEESRRRASDAAKSRRPPSHESAASSSKRPKS